MQARRTVIWQPDTTRACAHISCRHCLSKLSCDRQAYLPYCAFIYSRSISTGTSRYRSAQSHGHCFRQNHHRTIPAACKRPPQNYAGSSPDKRSIRRSPAHTVWPDRTATPQLHAQTPGSDYTATRNPQKFYVKQQRRLQQKP